MVVIENGHIDDSPTTSIPYFANIINTAAMHPIMGAPEPFLNNLTFPVRVANVVGGGSVVNGMQFDRGTNADYDAWEHLGNPGWGWKSLEPYFRKLFKFTPPSESTQKEFGITFDASAYGNGLVQVSIPSFQYPDTKPIFDSWRAENISKPQEGFADPIGTYWSPSTIDNATATRSHARKTYYDPIQSRPNLKLFTGTHTDRIVFDTTSESITAVGVEITSRVNGSSTYIHARQEVILAAGGIFTPHLLMVSGVGPKDVLEAAKIPVKLNRPGVGSNFQDHTPAYMSFNLSNQQFPNPDSLNANASFNASAAAQYEKDRSGPWSLGRANLLSMLTLKQFSSRYQALVDEVKAQKAEYLPERYTKSPDGRYLYAGYVRQRDHLISQYLSDEAVVGEFPVSSSGRATAALQKQLSRGTITLNTTHPHAYPIVTYNTLQNPVDKKLIVELVRFNRKHWARLELERYKPVELVPGAQYQSDDEIIEGLIKTNAINPSFSHPSGSCSMLPEELGGCVSDQLLVHGAHKLSVVDASILPMIPAAHLQATMYVVAEKASDIIKARSMGAHK